jgi:RimJ/RimL family protein N-acetyltransferase
MTTTTSAARGSAPVPPLAAGAPTGTSGDAPPRLRKATRVVGHRLVFRDATPADAAFILRLRTDPAKNAHLSATAPSLEAQSAWLARYAQDDTQAYFVIENRDGRPVGTVRLYDARGASFCWGSWIKDDGAPLGFAMESALMVYTYALHLGFTAAHFDVRVDNEHVWAFHEKLGARRVATHGPDHFYEMDGETIRRLLATHARHLPAGIEVEPAPAAHH